MSDPLLSDLCTICHTNPPKYRCPRCSIRTCSLPCSRKHKKWSQCSGQRDPAAYATRAQLATPEALDRDFNFIAGVERNLERAEREARARGFDDLEFAYMQPAQTSNNKHKRKRGNDDSRKGDSGPTREGRSGGRLAKGELAFLRAAEQAGVKIVRAPKGMTRNRENKSRVHPKHKCLSWTLEWITPDTPQRTLQNCLETVTFRQAYDRVYPVKDDRPITTSANTTTTDTTVVAAAAAASTTSTAARDTADEGNKIQSHRNVYFYLRRRPSPPRTVVLAPVHPDTAIAAALRGRTVLEFPSVYVLDTAPMDVNHRPSSSTERFVLEEEWVRENPEYLDVEQGTEEGKEEGEDEDYTSSEGSSESDSDQDVSDGSDPEHKSQSEHTVDGDTQE